MTLLVFQCVSRAPSLRVCVESDLLVQKPPTSKTCGKQFWQLQFFWVTERQWCYLLRSFLLVLSTSGCLRIAGKRVDKWWNGGVDLPLPRGRREQIERLLTGCGQRKYSRNASPVLHLLLFFLGFSEGIFLFFFSIITQFVSFGRLLCFLCLPRRSVRATSRKRDSTVFLNPTTSVSVFSCFPFLNFSSVKIFQWFLQDAAQETGLSQANEM